MILFNLLGILSAVAGASIPPHGVSVPAAQSVKQRETKLSEQEIKKEETSKVSKKRAKKFLKASSYSITTVSSSVEQINSNLPVYLQNINREDYKGDSQVFAASKTVSKLNGVRSGDIYKAVVDQEIVASANLPTPIRAMVISGNLKGSYFVGEATLDRDLKRVILSFAKIRKQDGNMYSVKASGLSRSGSIGLEGEYHSQTGMFFLGELASATAAGVLDSTINRNQTVLGTYVQEPSLSNSAKNGAVTALSKTADHFADQTKQAPEYTKIDGIQEIQVIIQDDPIELGNN